MFTHCPDCRSFSLTTAQLVSDSSSVGHRAACIVWMEEKDRGGKEEHNLKDTEIIMKWTVYIVVELLVEFLALQEL